MTGPGLLQTSTMFSSKSARLYKYSNIILKLVPSWRIYFKKCICVYFLNRSWVSCEVIIKIICTQRLLVFTGKEAQMYYRNLNSGPWVKKIWICFAKLHLYIFFLEQIFICKIWKVVHSPEYYSTFSHHQCLTITHHYPLTGLTFLMSVRRVNLIPVPWTICVCVCVFACVAHVFVQFVAGSSPSESLVGRIMLPDYHIITI